MFDYESPKPKGPTDYTGLKIVALLAPVCFLITFLSNSDAGLAACIVLGMIMLAVKIRWNLRKKVWFWATIVFVLVLHIPLAFMIRWPHGSVRFYAMPIGIADFLTILVAIDTADKFFSKDSGFITINWP